MAFTMIYGDHYTSAAPGIKFPLQGGADMVEVRNITKSLDVTNAGMVRGYWYGSKFGAAQTAAGQGERWFREAGAPEIQIDNFTGSAGGATAGVGFTYVSDVPQVEAQSANAITAITAADPAVVTQTNTYSDGDILVFYSTTGMLQLGGIWAEISSNNGSAYTLTGIRGLNFAAAGTAGYTRRISNKLAVEPQFMFVTEVTKASQAVVRLSVNPGRYYTAGMMVHFNIPGSFGMTELNQKSAKIISIDETEYTITIDLDTSAYSTFAFPASASSPTARLFATMAPVGQKTQQDPLTGVYTGYDFNFAPYHVGQFTPYLWIPNGAWSAGGTADDELIISAYKYEN